MIRHGVGIYNESGTAVTLEEKETAKREKISPGVVCGEAAGFARATAGTRCQERWDAAR